MSPRQRVVTRVPSTESATSEGSSVVTYSSPKEPMAESSCAITNNKTTSKPLKDTPNDGALNVRDRDQHDLFNLIALPLVLAAVFSNWNLWSFLSGQVTLKQSWHSTYIYEATGVADAYFLMDLIWVSMVPTCVKSPGSIVKHHFVALAYLYAPIVMTEHRHYMGMILSVEINTWFLILRRFLFLRQDKTPQILRDFVDACFYISWILIRVFAYGWLLYDYLVEAARHVELYNTYFQIGFLNIIPQFILNITNLKWTYDLFMPMIKRRLFSSPSSTESSKEHTL